MRKREYEIICPTAQDSLANDGPAVLFCSVLPTPTTLSFHLFLQRRVLFRMSLFFQYSEMGRLSKETGM